VSTLAADRFNAAVTSMIGHLSGFLPNADATLALLEAEERPVGVGNWQGNVERGPLAVLGVRGGRVQARVRFDLRGATPQAASAAVLQLQQRVRAARLDPLTPWIHDFLVLEPDGGEPASLQAPGGPWRQSAEYRVLFEYRYDDPEGTGSLIVRIPLELRGEHHEDDAVTRDLTRWDRFGAPPLRVRGPRTLTALSALVHPGGGFPHGQVTVLRTHDGAVGLPTFHGTFGKFWTEVQGGARHDAFVFLTLGGAASFMAAFADEDEDGNHVVDTVRLMDPAGTPVDYRARVLRPPVPVRLAGPGERLEVSYLDPTLTLVQDKFPDPSRTVVYLRAGRGRSA
jgi:hypothetical protein